MTPEASMALLLIIVFLAGFGWGCWFTELHIRKDKDKSEIGRLSISMPMVAKDASNLLGTLKHLLDKIEQDKP